jgi:hypothetical protein
MYAYVYMKMGRVDDSRQCAECDFDLCIQHGQVVKPWGGTFAMRLDEWAGSHIGHDECQPCLQAVCWSTDQKHQAWTSTYANDGREHV